MNKEENMTTFYQKYYENNSNEFQTNWKAILKIRT